MKTQTRYQQGDLLRVTLTDAGGNKHIQTPVEGWLCVTESAVDGSVIQGNFSTLGESGYGGVTWPSFKLKFLVRGEHGETSPFAALCAIGLHVPAVQP